MAWNAAAQRKPQPCCEGRRGRPTVARVRSCIQRLYPNGQMLIATPNAGAAVRLYELRGPYLHTMVGCPLRARLDPTCERCCNATDLPPRYPPKIFGKWADLVATSGTYLARNPSREGDRTRETRPELVRSRALTRADKIRSTGQRSRSISRISMRVLSPGTPAGVQSACADAGCVPRKVDGCGSSVLKLPKGNLAWVQPRVQRRAGRSPCS